MEQALRDGVGRYPNVEVLLERECLRVRTDGDHVELLLADLHSDTFDRVRAGYVIAADGGSSPTRGQLGVGYVGKTYAERWVVIDTKVLQEWDSHDRLRFHCDPVRPMVDCPTPLGHHRWEFPAHAGESDEKLVRPDEVWKVLNAGGITDEQVELQRAVVYSHHVRVADRWRVGRIFLAGDAAHAMPPWIGQGMSAGVRDAANLCWKLAAVLQGRAPDALLDSYQAERMPHVTEVTKRAVLVGRVITERRRAVAAIRNHLLRTVTRIPGVLGASQRIWWIPAARYGDGLLRRLAPGRRVADPAAMGARRHRVHGAPRRRSGWRMGVVARRRDAWRRDSAGPSRVFASCDWPDRSPGAAGCVSVIPAASSSPGSNARKPPP